MAEGLPAGRWSRQTMKEGSKGPLVAHYAAVRVIAVREGLPGPEGSHAVYVSYRKRRSELLSQME